MKPYRSRFLALVLGTALACGCIPNHPPHTPQPVPELPPPPLPEVPNPNSQAPLVSE
jgi:hypothetical protein